MLRRPLVWMLAGSALAGLLRSQRCAGAAATARNRDAAGEAFIHLLAQGDFAGAEAMLDGTMKAAMPEEKLRQTWQGLLASAGAFRKIRGTQSGDQQGYHIVLVTCEFEKRALNARVVLDAKDQVAGLFFFGAGTFKTPDYAQADSYTEQDFTVGTGEWQLPGTLTMPNARWATGCAAVVLVHGSGPNDRDETVGSNKPFRDLAWGLASRGIAVLRYEKRTSRYADRLKAPGGLAGFTVKEETLDDALAAAAQLRKTPGIDPGKVFILGHSLGATVAPRMGRADPALAGLILLAGATRPLEEMMVEQTRYLLSLNGSPSKEEQQTLDAMLAEAAKIKALTPADAARQESLFFAPPAYWLDLRSQDELAIARTLKMPLLIAQGARDYQVTTEDFDNWKKALAGQANVTFKLYPDLNHLFETGTGKSKPAEYDTPSNVDPHVVGDIADWIGQVVAK